MQVRFKKFNQQPFASEVFGSLKKKAKVQKKSILEKKPTGAIRIKQKLVIDSKVRMLRKKMSAYTGEVFDELIKVVRSNPNLALEDLASMVFRNLKAKHPSNHYASSTVSNVFLLAKKEGAIITSPKKGAN